VTVELVSRSQKDDGRGEAGARRVSIRTGMLRVKASGRKSSQHLDGDDVRVSTLDDGSRVNASMGTESESAPRMTEIESAP